MGDQLYNIPIGFRFEPSDEELIRGFLLPKVMGYPLPWNGIVEKELYGDNAAPWDVFNDIDGDNSLYCNTKRDGDTTKKTVYVLTKVTKSSSNSKKVSRSAGCGTWNGQTGPKNIKNSTTGDIIGLKKMLSFKRSKTDGDANSDLEHWIMHEYSLTGEWSSDVVLCRIIRCIKDSRRRPIPPPPETNKRAAEDQLEGEEESGGKKQKTDDVVGGDWNLTAEDIERLIMDSDDQKSNDEVEGCTLTAEDIERILMEDDDDEESGGKKQKTDVVEDWNLTAADLERLIMDSDDQKTNDEVEGCTLTAAGDREIIFLDSDDDEVSNYEVEGCTLTAGDREIISLDSDDDEVSNYEVEGCTVAEESAVALPSTSSTTTGEGIIEEENGGDINGNCTLSYGLDDDIGLVFSHLNFDMAPKSIDEFFEGF